jgi:hypothetical protein
MRLGWTFDELFALAEPFANVSLQGAAWFVGNATVAAVTADAITLRTPSGSTLRIYRKQKMAALSRAEKLRAEAEKLFAEV